MGVEFTNHKLKLRYLIVYIGLSVFIITSMVTIVFHYLGKKELTRSIENFIKESKNTIERRIERDIVAYLETNLLRYSRSSTYSLFYETPNADMEFLNKIRISIIDSIRTEEHISDIILYRVDDNAVVSALKSGYTMESLAANFDDIKSIIANTDQIEKAKLHVTSDKKPAYIFPVIHANRWKEGAYRGFATLYLNNPKKFFDVEIDTFNQNGTFVIISNNSIIYAQGSNTLSDEILFEMIDSAEVDTLVQKYVHSLDYTFYYNDSASNGLKYLYYEPTPNFFKLMDLNPNYYSFYGMSMVLILIFTTIIYYLFKQIHKNYTEQKQVVNEYANELMKTNQPASVDLVIDKYLNIEAKFPNYSIVVVDPDINYLAGLSEKQRKFTIEELKEVAKNIFKSLELPHIVSSQLQGYVSCIVNYEDHIDKVMLVNQLSEAFKKYSKCPFNIFYTDSYIGTTDATKGYTRILELLKYSYIYNYDHIFSLSELEEMESNNNIIEARILEIVQGYLTEFNSQNFIQYLHTTLAYIRKAGYSYNQIIDFFNIILLALKNFFTEKSMDYPLKSVPIAEQLKQFQSLEECIAFIQVNLNKYKETLLQNNSSTNRRYMENILKYIDDYIEDITLSSVAEEFHITSAHLSRIFKENVGVNFSEYVTEKKLLHAAKLLRENQNMNIIELANKLGYNTPSYFSTKFKERFGVTPGVYKKECLANK